MEIIHRHAAWIDLVGNTSNFVAIDIGQEVVTPPFPIAEKCPEVVTNVGHCADLRSAVFAAVM